jgi:hypothetical protein
MLSGAEDDGRIGERRREWQRSLLRAAMVGIVGAVPLTLLVGAALRIQWLSMPTSLVPRRISSRSIFPKVAAMGAFAFGSLAATSLTRSYVLDGRAAESRFIAATKEFAVCTATGALLARVTAWRRLGALFVGLVNASLFVLVDRSLYRPARPTEPLEHVKATSVQSFSMKAFCNDWLCWLPFMGERGREIERLQAILASGKAESNT